MEIFEVIIIGKGPAGISAALYTVRAGLKTLVVGSGASSLQKADKIENYYGFENPVSGRELLETGIRQAARLGAVVVSDEVTSLEYDSVFKIKTVSNDYSSKAVLIATGQPPKRPSIPGVKDFEGSGVSYCTTCDGFFYKNKKVGILGNGNYAVQEAMELEHFTKDITIFTDGQNPAFSGDYAKTAEKYKIESKHILGLIGDRILGEIKLEDGLQRIDGLFIASGTASSVDFAIKLGVNVKDNSIITDEWQKTNLNGIFAAGDCTGGFKQVSIAVGEGAIAGKSIIEFIRQGK